MNKVKKSAKKKMSLLKSKLRQYKHKRLKKKIKKAEDKMDRRDIKNTKKRFDYDRPFAYDLPQFIDEEEEALRKTRGKIAARKMKRDFGKKQIVDIATRGRRSRYLK